MLFNTLAYAKFFAVVFVACWVLVNRRWVPLLPWLALLIYGVSQRPTLLTFGLGALSLAFSAALCSRHREDLPPAPRLAAASVLVNLTALSFLTYRDHGVDPLTYVLVPSACRSERARSGPCRR